MPNTLAAPLDGIRIIDLTTVLYGPYATQTLGDLGAEIIKVEPPGGDPTRSIGPAREAGMGAGFLGVNRNKKSVLLDLKHPPALDALWCLIDGADMFVHNIRPQKMSRLGLAPDAVMSRNNTIIYGAFHGYLEEGPYGGRPAYDDVIQGESGIAAAFMARDGEPAFAPSVIADKSAGLIAANALTAALFQRSRSSEGVYVEIGMFESMVAYTLLEHQFGLIFSPREGGGGYTRVISPERKPYRTADGYICMLAYTDQQWHTFWKLANTPEMIGDTRFESMKNRTEHVDALYGHTGKTLRGRPSAEWLARLSEAQIPCGPVNDFTDLLADPHLQAIDFFRAQSHPTQGKLQAMDNGLRFNRERLSVREHQPRLGEQSETVLREAGLSEAAIKAALAL